MFSHIIHVRYIFTMVNVGKYTIHGLFGFSDMTMENHRFFFGRHIDSNGCFSIVVLAFWGCIFLDLF